MGYQYMKKRILLCFFTMIYIMTSGCSFEVSDDIDKTGIITGKKVFQYLKDNDYESIKMLFCETTQKDHDLDSELDHMNNLFKGNVLSYDKIRVTNSGSAVNKGKTENSHVSINIENIITDTGDRFSVSFYELIEYPENSDHEGIQQLSLWTGDEQEDRYIVGEFIV